MKKVLVTTVILALFTISVVLSFYYINNNDRKNIFGINLKSSELFADDTDRDFHGDGFSITVDSISDFDIKFFSSPSDVFFSDFPNKTSAGHTYQIHKWKKTPLNPSDTIATNFALNISSDLSSYVFKDEKKVLENLYAVARSLRKPGNLYSFSFRDNPYKVYGVNLYVIDLANKKVYIVNRQ